MLVDRVHQLRDAPCPHRHHVSMVCDDMKGNLLLPTSYHHSRLDTAVHLGVQLDLTMSGVLSAEVPKVLHASSMDTRYQH